MSIVGTLSVNADRISSTRGEQGGGTLLGTLLVVGGIAAYYFLWGENGLITRYKDSKRMSLGEFTRKTLREQKEFEQKHESRAKARGLTYEQYWERRRKRKENPFGLPDNLFGRVLGMIIVSIAAVVAVWGFLFVFGLFVEYFVL